MVHTQPGAVSEVHLRLSTRRVVLLEVHLTVRSVQRPVVAHSPLKRPQLGSSEPAGVSLIEPLQDGCRAQLTLGTGPQQRHDIALPHLRERVRSASPSPPGLLALRGKRSTLPFPADLSLMAADAAAACCVLPSINFCLSTTTC